MKFPARNHGVPLKWIFRLFLLSGGILILSLLVLTLFALHLSGKVEEGFLVLREAQPTQIYSDVLIGTLHGGIPPIEVFKHLEALQYRRVRRPNFPGEFKRIRHGSNITEFVIITRAFDFPYNLAIGSHTIPTEGPQSSKHLKLLFQNKKLIEVVWDQKKL